jgi:hypothetical protein
LNKQIVDAPLIVFTRVFTEFFVFVEERRLFLRIEFAGNVFLFFVNETKPMQQILDTIGKPPIALLAM